MGSAFDIYFFNLFLAGCVQILIEYMVYILLLYVDINFL